MNIEFDPIKSEKNRQERGLPFSMAHDFEWKTAGYTEDIRHEYPERRFVAVGWLLGRLCVLCFTPVPGGVRIISLRKANKREIKRHEKASY